MKAFLFITFFLAVAMPAYSQDSKVDQAEGSSSMLGNPARVGTDLGMMAVGSGAIFITKYKPQTEKVLAARREVEEVNARLWREAPELAEARKRFEDIHQMRTLEETAAERKELENLLNTINRTAGFQDSKVGDTRNWSEEGINSLRNAESHLRADLKQNSGKLIPLSEKTAMLKEAQRAIQEAEKLANIQRKSLQVELEKAEFGLKLEQGIALQRLIRISPWYYRIGGAVLVLGGGWDLYRAIINNTVDVQIATPDELGKMAVAIMEGRNQQDLDRLD